MHGISRTLTKKTSVLSNAANFKEIVNVRCVTTTIKSHSAAAQKTQDERQEAKAKKNEEGSTFSIICTKYFSRDC